MRFRAMVIAAVIAVTIIALTVSVPYALDRARPSLPTTGDSPFTMLRLEPLPFALAEDTGKPATVTFVSWIELNRPIDLTLTQQYLESYGWSTVEAGANYIKFSRSYSTLPSYSSPKYGDPPPTATVYLMVYDNGTLIAYTTTPSSQLLGIVYYDPSEGDPKPITAKALEDACSVLGICYGAPLHHGVAGLPEAKQLVILYTARPYTWEWGGGGGARKWVADYSIASGVKGLAASLYTYLDVNVAGFYSYCGVDVTVSVEGTVVGQGSYGSSSTIPRPFTIGVQGPIPLNYTLPGTHTIELTVETLDGTELNSIDVFMIVIMLLS